MKLLSLKTGLTIAVGLSLCGISHAQLSSSQRDTLREVKPGQVDISAMPDAKAIMDASEFVVLADIGKSKSRWVGRKIVTDWDVRVRESLKGRPAERLIVTTYGGEVDNIAQDFSHSAQLTSGETAILYLAPISKNSAQLSPKGHFIAYDEFGIIRVLKPGLKKSRLEHNRRLKRKLDLIKSDIKKIR